MQYPTLWVQEAFIVASGLESTNTMPAAWEIAGDFSSEEIVQAVQLVVTGHESLRTSFYIEGAQFRQRVNQAGSVAGFIRPLELAGSAEAKDALSDAMGRLLTHRFDLRKPPLWRGFLAKLGSRRWVLGMVFANVIADGASALVFSRHLARALEKGAPPPPTLQVGAIAVDERSRKIRDAHRRHWGAQYQQRSPLEAIWKGVAHYRVQPIPAFTVELVQNLGHLSQRLGVQPSIVHGAIAALTVRAALDRAWPMLGFTTARRRQAPELQETFGPLHDHLPVLGGVRSEASFAAFVREINQRREMARTLQVPAGALAGIAKYTPYDVAVNYAPFPDPEPHRVGKRGTVLFRPVTTIGRVELGRATSVAPVLAAILRPRRDGSLTGDITAVSKTFTAEAVETVAQAYAELATKGVRNPDRSIRDLVRSVS